MKPPTLPPLLVAIARAEIGVDEINGTNCGPRVDQYKAATNLPPHEPWAWCAAFVCWCVDQAMHRAQIADPNQLFTFKRPRTAGAWDLENWSLAQDASTLTKRAPASDIEAGDVLLYTFSHCGIAASNAQGRYIMAVEGNTDSAGSREGGGVRLKTRRLTDVKTRIRFRV